LLVVVVLVAVLLWLLFRNADLPAVWGHIRAADGPLLLASAVIAMAGFAARAARWRYFLAPVQPRSPFGSRFAAVAVGFMANNLLPSGRAGEPGRAYAYSRLEPVGFTAALATLVVERLLDGAVIFALLFLAILSPDFPAESLPEQLSRSMHIAAAGRVKEGRARHAIKQQQGQRAGQKRRRHDSDDAGRQNCPAEQGHAPDGHLGRPHIEDRHDEIDRPHDGGNAEQVRAQSPKRLPVAAEDGREGRVGGPASFGRADEVAEQHHDGGRWNQPEGEGVQPGESHILGP